MAIKNASKSRKIYLQEVAALTDVLLRIEEAVEESTAHSSLNRRTVYTNEAIKECRKHLSGLKARLEDHVDERKKLGRLKSTLVWPFVEKELKQNIEMLHRFRGIFADAMTAETL
jgi:hypothetical protein